MVMCGPIIRAYNIYYVCRYAFDDRDRHWDFHVPDDSKYLSWEDYIKKSFGMIESKPCGKKRWNRTH